MASESVHGERLARVRSAMEAQGVDVLLLSLGADLPWLTGYEAMPLERLTMLVVPRGDDATLLVPRLEAPRVEPLPAVFAVRPWEETEDPGRDRGVARRSGPVWSPSVTGRGRSSSSTSRCSCRRDLAAGVDGDVTPALGEGPGRGRRAAARRCSRRPRRRPAPGRRDPARGAVRGRRLAELGRRLLAEGHARVNFAIVAAGPNAASPHHEPGERVIEAASSSSATSAGTTPDGYCSDITRCVHTGPVPGDVAEAYALLHEAQARAVRRRRSAPPARTSTPPPGTTSRAAATGPDFIHRTGHGIGLEAHEDPYLVAGNASRCRRARLLDRARDLPRGPLGAAPRGHRRGHRCRPGAR
jgi:Xaa-Pro aminopeptidase